MTENTQVVLASRPKGIPQAEHFRVQTVPVRQPDAGEVLIRNCFLSVEPAMKGWVSAVGNYSEPVGIDEVMRSFAIGIVEQSQVPDYRPGEYVTGLFGWQTHATVESEKIDRTIAPDDQIPVSTHLGVLGLNGITAYFGLLDCGRPVAGETVVVSTAAGAVGSAVGQIAKLHGCRVVGIAGGADKVTQCVREFGFDACLDYKSEKPLKTQLEAACPDGIDVYFDNTSGSITDTVMTMLNVHSRVVICGTASVASWDPIPPGPRIERHILVKRATVRGILVFDYADQYESARSSLRQWILEGKLKYSEDILEGIDAAPDAIAGLYRGENRGKRLIKL